MKLKKSHRYVGFQSPLENMVYKFFDKKTGSRVTSKVWVIVNEKIAEELHKPVTKKSDRKKICAWFKDNIWTPDLAEMESLFSKNKNFKYLLCVIDVFTKYS